MCLHNHGSSSMMNVGSIYLWRWCCTDKVTTRWWIIQRHFCLRDMLKTSLFRGEMCVTAALQLTGSTFLWFLPPPLSVSVSWSESSVLGFDDVCLLWGENLQKKNKCWIFLTQHSWAFCPHLCACLLISAAFLTVSVPFWPRPCLLKFPVCHFCLFVDLLHLCQVALLVLFCLVLICVILITSFFIFRNFSSSWAKNWRPLSGKSEGLETLLVLQNVKL